MTIGIVRTNMDVGTGGVKTSISSPEERINKAIQEAANAVTDITLVSSQPVYNSSLEAVSINAFLEQASDALDEIVDLRAKQIELAERAQDYNDSTKRTSMNTEYTAIETEIQRIASQSYNGQSLLQERRVFSVTNTEKDFAEIVSFGNETTLFANQNLSLTSQSGAETAEDTLDALYESTTVFRSDVKIARDKSRDVVDTINAKELAARYEDPIAIKSAEEAAIVAKTIADEIASIANRGEEKAISSKQALVDQIHNLSSLDPSRIHELLG